MTAGLRHDKHLLDGGELIVFFQSGQDFRDYAISIRTWEGKEEGRQKKSVSYLFAVN